MPMISLTIAGETYRADTASACDISIPFRFDEPQLQVYGAPAARAEIYRSANFVGDVKQGGSCNCHRYLLTPHCNGTHTESVGHITHDPLSINTLALHALMLAKLITIEPTSTHKDDPNSDLVITLQSLQHKLDQHTGPEINAVIVRTKPNTADKKTRNYDEGRCPAYFKPDALAWLADLGINHLLVDLPSVDRMDDGGRLLAHRAFWGLPAEATLTHHATRPQATITELIYAPEQLQDGLYLMSLQVAPFVSDASPSRPLLYRLLP